MKQTRLKQGPRLLIIAAALLGAAEPGPAADKKPNILDYPPMQRGASFNLDAVKAELGKRMEQAEAASHGTGQ
jgi:hypothetical protein